MRRVGEARLVTLGFLFGSCASVLVAFSFGIGMLLFALTVYIAYRDRILPWYWETSLLDDAVQPMIHSGLRDRVLILRDQLRRFRLVAPQPRFPNRQPSNRRPDRRRCRLTAAVVV